MEDPTSPAETTPALPPVRLVTRGWKPLLARLRRFCRLWLPGLLVLPWALFLQLLFALPLFVGLAALGTAGLLDVNIGDSSVLLLLGTAAYLGVCPVLWLTWRKLEGGTLADLGHGGGLRRALGELVGGTLLGVLIMSMIVGLAAGAGLYDIQPADWQAGLKAQVIWLPALLLAAYFEELVLRGYCLQALGRRWPLLGLAVSSLLFSAVHALNPNLLSLGLAGALVIGANIFVAGLLLGGAFLLSGRLWLPTGLHLGWNWTTAVLFGLPVSGLDLPSLLETSAGGEPSLLTGGDFGPEASLPALALVAPLGLWLTFRVIAGKRRVPLVERRAARTPARGADTIHQAPGQAPSPTEGG